MILSRDTDAQQGLFIILFLGIPGSCETPTGHGYCRDRLRKIPPKITSAWSTSRDFGLREASGYG
jgi:hypothetical protein